MKYDMPLYRPPSEAYSLIIQVTLGCSHNECSFCDMYKNKKFIIKNIDAIKNEIDIFRKNTKEVKRIFLADGDALIIKFEILKEILLYIKEKFPECNRISLYGSPKSIMLKSENELKELKKLGLFIVYLGVESGDDEVLKNVNKGVNSKEILKAALKIKNTGIKLSVTAIAGLGGKEKSKNHAIKTGEIISKISPEYFSILTLMYNSKTKIYEQIKNRELTPLKNTEVLEEIKYIIKNIDAKSGIIFRSNHASNYISLEGILPKDKEKLIKDIEKALKEEKFILERYRSL